MNKLHIAIAALTLMTAGAVLAPAQYVRGNGAGQKQGQGQGKKMGPRDGSGPIHTPGTGGGTGSGQRGKR